MYCVVNLVTAEKKILAYCGHLQFFIHEGIGGLEKYNSSQNPLFNSVFGDFAQKCAIISFSLNIHFVRDLIVLIKVLYCR